MMTIGKMPAYIQTILMRKTLQVHAMTSIVSTQSLVKNTHQYNDGYVNL